MRNTQMKNETTVKIAGETERETALCDALKSARSEQNVKAEFYVDYRISGNIQRR